MDIKNLEVHRSDGEWETIAVDTEPFNLKAIEGIQDFLAEQIVEAGTYTQVRFEVNSVTVVTDDDVEHDAKVPSGRIKLVGAFQVVGGEPTEITLDFNGKKSVVVTGNGEYIFKPVIKLLVAGRGRPNELNELEGALGISDNATATLSEDEYHAGSPSVHLATTGGQGTGDEARIVVELPKDTTLGDIESISWWEYLVAGYPPHVDIVMDVGGGEDRLVLEYAYNDHYAEGGPSYGALLDAWYQTFGDDGQGPTAIGDSALGWLASGPSGPPEPNPGNFGTLGEWKNPGITYGSISVSAATPAIALEIEIDSWLLETEAYVDDIEIVIDGVTYSVVFE